MSKRNRKGKGLDEKKIKLLTAIIAAIGTLLVGLGTVLKGIADFINSLKS
ncbi:MAG: hypothetical protein J6N21_14005 [Butyrivibrio sp.]|nr:hypothetical protein [Butyrivibrio sp.]